jgi:hypothetical protein
MSKLVVPVCPFPVSHTLLCLEVQFKFLDTPADRVPWQGSASLDGVHSTGFTFFKDTWVLLQIHMSTLNQAYMYWLVWCLVQKASKWCSDFVIFYATHCLDGYYTLYSNTYWEKETSYSHHTVVSRSLVLCTKCLWVCSDLSTMNILLWIWHKIWLWKI